MRGIRFNIVDAQPHPDPAHRKAAQILPATKRLLHGLQLKSRPTLLEPIFLCEITSYGRNISNFKPEKRSNIRRKPVVRLAKYCESLSPCI